MKHSLWRLISSFYILLISGLMVIISAYAWMVISKAPGVTGPSIDVNLPQVFYDKITISKEALDTFPIEAIDSTVKTDGTVEFKIDSAEDFVIIMRAVGDGRLSGKIALRLCAQISLEDTSVWNDAEWQGIEVSDTIEKLTLYADTAALKTSTAFIQGLPDTLFRSVDAASVELRDVVLTESEISGNGHVGAFVSYAAEQASVSLINCHVAESNIVGMGYSVGAMIGYADFANVFIKDCTVTETSLQGTIAGEMLGTVNDGSTVIANAVCLNNVLPATVQLQIGNLYGYIDLGETGMLNLVDTEFATVDAYGGFIQTAADCFDGNTAWQTWSVYGSLKMANEIRFRGNHIDIVGKENAVIELSGNAGFNFGQPEENPITEKFQSSSSVKFADITFHNKKENTNDYAYYMYANARNVVYSDCNFDRGVIVFGSAHFTGCEITDDSRYCVKFVGNASNLIISISDSVLNAGENAEGCVIAEGTTQLFALSNSDFDNDTAVPAVYITGIMPILTDGQNYFDSPCGGILAKNEGTCAFNGQEYDCPTFEQYQNADILTKSQMNRTEHGNNAAAQTPDAEIPYDSVDADQIPLEVNPDSVDTETDTKIYYIDSAEKFIAVMRMLNQKDENGASLLSGNYKIVLKAHIDLTAYFTAENIWESVSVNDTAKALKTITIEADTSALGGASTAYIKGLNAPWFGALESKSTASKIVFEDITAIYSVMNLKTEEFDNGGVLIAKTKISASLTNCHVLNSEIFSTPNAKGEYARLGALIGYTNAAEVMIRNCSVRGCTLKGASVGGIVGHAGASELNETYIVDCFVETSTLVCLEENATWRVGEFVGTANRGGLTVVNPLVLENILIQETASDHQKNEENRGNDPYYFLYGRFSSGNVGRMVFVDNQSEIHKALVYGGLNVKSTQFLTSNEQLWLIYDTAYLKTEIRFNGSDITLKPYGENATILLNSKSKGGFSKGLTTSASGFNFGEVGQYTNSFKPDSTMRFQNLTIQNQKTYETTKTVRTNDRSYTYAYAENVYFTNCKFEGGVVVYANGSFDDCYFTTLRKEDLCLVLADENGNTYACEIKISSFTVSQDSMACVVSNGNKVLTVENSEFRNDTVYPAVSLNGATTVNTDKNNIFYSPNGGILALTEDSFFNGEICVTKSEYESADQLEKANYDRTEHGNNGSVQKPDYQAGYSSVTGEIPDISQIKTNADGAYLIQTADELIAVMQMLNRKTDGVSNISANVTIILQGHFDLSDHDWESVVLNDTGKLLKTITIKADTAALGTSTAFIKGLNAPLFGQTVSGASSAKLILENITITDSVMNLATADYSNSGAFIGNADFIQGSVSVINCHLLNSKIITAPNEKGEYSRVGGIIGYTKTSNALIQDCSVRGCNIVGASVGGIVGHASASQSNETYIVDCFVENTTLTCLEADATWRVGEIVGTANQGGLTVVNPMVQNNALIQETASDIQKTEANRNGDPYYFLYGRFVPSGKGKMIFVDNKTDSELHTAVVYGGLNPEAAKYLTSDKQEWLLYGSVRLKEEIRFNGNDITLKPYGESADLILNSNSTSVFWKGASSSPSGFNFGEIGEYRNAFKPGSIIRFENLTIQNQKTYYNSNIPRNDERSYTYAYAENVFFTNCTFEGGVVVYANASFEACYFSASENGVSLVLSEENIVDGDYVCILENCTVKEYQIETNGRIYEIKQTKTK